MRRRRAVFLLDPDSIEPIVYVVSINVVCRRPAEWLAAGRDYSGVTAEVVDRQAVQKAAPIARPG